MGFSVWDLIPGARALRDAFDGIVRSVKAQGMSIAVGKEGKVYLPEEVANLNALVVRGEMGARWRIIGVVVRREH